MVGPSPDPQEAAGRAVVCPCHLVSSRTDAAWRRQRAPRDSLFPASPPPAARGYPSRCLWQQIILIFSINRAKVLSKWDI